MSDSQILLIEDDLKISQFLAKELNAAGFDVDVAGDGQCALGMAQAKTYDLMLLDLMLPKMDGLSVLSELRARGDRAKVLILSAKRKVDDRVAGLEVGADDYLTKPFVFTELLARCRALLRRIPTTNTLETRLVSGSIELDLLTREARLEGEKIDLRPKEFALLEYFLRNPGQVLTKYQILAKVWRYNFDPQTNVVDVLVCRLRTKLHRSGQPKLIQTRRGVGYVYSTT